MQGRCHIPLSGLCSRGSRPRWSGRKQRSARSGLFRSATTFSAGCRKKPFGAYPGHFSLYPIVGEASPYYSGNRIHTESAASRHHSLQRGFPWDGQAVTFLLPGHIVQVCHHRQKPQFTAAFIISRGDSIRNSYVGTTCTFLTIFYSLCAHLRNVLWVTLNLRAASRAEISFFSHA